MPVDQDYLFFRKYVGDFEVEAIDEDIIDEYLNDATVQATAPHITPDNPIITSYDNLPQKFVPEVVLLAAINWWWNKAARYSDRITSTVGQASEQASDRWMHAMEVIQQLQGLYDDTKALGQDPDMGNLSHWSRQTLTRVGGLREEDDLATIWPNTY